MNESAQLKQEIDRLTRSNDDLAQFAYLAAHELQEPLRAMTAFLSLLQNKHSTNLSEEATEWLQEAISAADRMSLLVYALLTMSRIESQEIIFGSASTKKCVQDAISNLRTEIEKTKAQVVTGELPQVRGNEILLTLLIQNLLSNSLKFCRVQPSIEIKAAQGGAEWIFSVKDNGVGFDMNYVERLFHRFQRLHPKAEFPGNGLGLALCKRIVDRHGGRIWAESDGQHGATFCFALPAHSLE